MSITQLSDKTNIVLRKNKNGPLEHTEGDGNFTQLENAIDDISNIINSLGLLDNIPTMIDEKTNKIAADLANTSEDLTRRTQAAIDKINQTTDAITEIKRVGEATHRQLEYASTIYTNEYSEYDERLLFGIIDTAIKRLRDSTQSDLNNLKSSLHEIAFSGNIEYSIGSLDFFGRLKNIPQWIRETHDDNGALYIRSSDGSQFRIGDKHFDLFGEDNKTIFRINTTTGKIEQGVIDKTQIINLAKVALDNNYYSLTDLPTLADSTNKPMRYGADVPDFMNLEYDDARIPSVSIVAQQRDGLLNKISLLDKSLSTIAKSGKITDAIGDLPWDRINEKPPWTNNLYTGDGDTVVTSRSGAGKLSINDEWINFYPKGKGSCFSVGPDGRIYDAKINHDQVLGLGTSALNPDTAYERNGNVDSLKNSLSKIAFSGDFQYLTEKPEWMYRLYTGGGSGETGIMSSSGATRFSIGDGELNFYPEKDSGPKLSVGIDGVLRNCQMPIESIIGIDSLASKAGTARITSTKDNNGYIRFENGTILQFCTGGFGKAEMSEWISFPMPFPNACLWAGVSTRMSSQDRNTNTWYQLISWDNYTAEVYRQIVDSGANNNETAPYIFAIGF